jgi:hypothetical protein
VPRKLDHTEALLAAAAAETLTWRTSGRGLSYRLGTGEQDSRLLTESERRSLEEAVQRGRLERVTPHGRRPGVVQYGPVVITPAERVRQARAAARTASQGG